MSSNLNFIFSVLFCAFVFNASAQKDTLHTLTYNPQIRLQQLQSPNTQKVVQTTDTLTLPFIDDFSSSSVYPDADKWIDKNVFINNNFPLKPPTIGVATFDGLDSLGNAYDNSTPSVRGLSDILTSKPINLKNDNQGNLYQLSDSIWLTFFVERKGRRGPAPGPTLNDSLTIEFYDTDSLKWSTMLTMKGGAADTVFTKIKIPVTDAKFLDNSFQFRFKSYGFLTGNLSHWHIDYVMLQRNFAPYDNNIYDIAFRYPLTSFLNEYTALPWNHFITNPNMFSLLKTSMSAQAFNNNGNAPINVRFTDAIFQGSLSNQVFYHDGGSNNLNPQTDTLYNYPLNNFNIANNSLPNETFYMVNKMSNQLTGGGQDNIRTNDSIVTTQVFNNYYAYDDGTAEAGYSITNAVNAKIAMRFDLLQADTIRAVQIFFVQQYDNSALNTFRLAIWNSLTPENLLYQRTSLLPVYTDSINGFATYAIPDTILILQGTVYIGLICNLAKDYDLGFDFNTNNQSKMFFNSNGNWVNTTFQGSFMIRPIFGDSAIYAGLHDLAAKDEIVIYPNPAGSYLKIQALKNYNQAKIISTIGNTITEIQVIENMINIDALKPGMYYLQLHNGSTIINRKFIKQ